MEEDSLPSADAGHLSANQKIFRLCSRECKLNENLRQDLFSKLEIKHIHLWNETEKIKYFFETATESDLQTLAKFVSNSFEKHRKYLNKA